MAFAKSLFRNRHRNKSLRRIRTSQGTAQPYLEADHHLSEGERINLFSAFIEKRRVLYAPAVHLTEVDASISVSKILIACGEHLGELQADAPAVAPLSKIEGACHRFLETTAGTDAVGFYVALGAFRSIVSEQSEALLAISIMYHRLEA